MAKDRNWWEDVDPEYARMSPKWQYVNDIYACDPDVIRQKDKYIRIKGVGEHADNYTDRLALAKCLPFVATVADGFTGRVETGKVTRRFSRDDNAGLGSREDPDTLVGKVWYNADGNGTNYLPMLSKVATQLTLKKAVFGLVEGYRKDEETGELTGNPYFRIVPVESVPIQVEDQHGALIGAVVKHKYMSREDPFAPLVEEDRYTIYTLEGHATFRIVEDIEERTDGGTARDPISYGGETADFFYYRSQELTNGNRMLPLFRIELPMDRYPAYTLAHLNVVYMNHASELQNKHRTCNILKFQLVTSNEDDEKGNVDSIIEGSAIVTLPADSRRDHKYIEPDASSLEETRAWLKESLAEFLFSALREYENSVSSASQKTATEVNQESADGTRSYLNTLAAALDEFETQVWRRLEQVEAPAKPLAWGHFSVMRKRDFKPLDEDIIGARLRATYFGVDPVPIGSKGRESVAKQIGDSDDVAYDDDEVAEDIARHDREKEAFSSLSSEMGI